jgi:hypothetical protein
LNFDNCGIARHFRIYHKFHNLYPANRFHNLWIANICLNSLKIPGRTQYQKFSGTKRFIGRSGIFCTCGSVSFMIFDLESWFPPRPPKKVVFNSVINRLDPQGSSPPLEAS